MTVRQVADASGGLISPTHVSAIERGSTSNVRDTTLDGLVVALGISDTAIRRAVGFTRNTMGPFKLPARADRLNERERKVVLALIDTILAAKRR